MSRITVDAEDLIAALQNHSHEFEYFLDRTTGEIAFLGDEDVVPEDEKFRSEIENDPDRFLVIDPIRSTVSWQIMADFIERLPPGEITERLISAVQRSSPFRRFKDELIRHPDLRQDWFAFEYLAMLALAREWLVTEGIEAQLKTRENAPRS